MIRTAALALVLAMTGCVAPSLTVYGRGTAKGKDGTSKTVAVKEVQIYGDLVGASNIVGSNVSIHTEGGYYNSTVVRETYDGAAKVGRAVVQPIIFGAFGASAIGSAAGAARAFVPVR